MTLFLTENDVLELFPMERALECVEESLRAQHRGAVNRSRERILLPGCSLHYMAAALPDEKLIGMKIYTVAQGGIHFLVLLMDAATGDWLAMMEADHLGRLRTGAASGVASRFMARPNASRAGLIGTGRQARTQLVAVAQVRKLEGARVYGRDKARRLAFCREMSETLRLAVEPAESAEAAARYGDIVITATSSHQPVLRGEWLRPGTHLNAIGANMANRRELDDEAVSRAALIAVDSLPQTKIEAGDLIQGCEHLPRGWEGVIELHEIVSGAQPGRRSPEEITLFKSCGIALWDLAAAAFIYRGARERGLGSELPLWEGTPGH